ncbi:MAG: bifunctional tRNA (5-methylaminomethyl-2-thiouridine)(34)-methyltransferase MnmD/FAD-dependent 5-carboxymethylaminomethyl-2-thiouridine(34) oxidoreductase MnmC [Vibrio sp.]
MTSIVHANLNWNESGTPVSDQFDDVYFSNHNGLEESRYVFIAQNELPARFEDHPRDYFVVAETGFGTGLNFLALWKVFEQYLAQTPNSNTQRLHFISFEKFPVKKEDLIKAHQAWPELADYAKALQYSYPEPTHGCQRIELAQGRVILDLWFGDIHHSLPKIINPQNGVVDAWFLDGFAPSKNPDMWNQDLFDAMANLSKPDASLATFTAAGFVRRGLQQAGFSMSKAKGFGHKREMLVGRLLDPKPKQHSSEVVTMPALDGTHKRIHVIGGGIASACLAKQLIQRGYDVDLYCQEAVGYGASSNKQGAIYPLLAEPEKNITQFFAPAFIYARAYYQNALDQGVSFQHDWCGVTQVGWCDKAQAKLDKMAHNGFTQGLIQSLDANALSEKAGIELGFKGVYYPQGGWLCPMQATQNLIQTLQDSGKLTLHSHTQVQDLTWLEHENKWQLSCIQVKKNHEAVSIKAEVVVVANGYQVRQFEQTQPIPTSAVKGQVSHIPAKDKLSQLKTVLCYDGYLTPVDPSDQHHCIGASHDRAHLDRQFDPAAQHSNVERLKACFNDKEWAKQADGSDNISRQGIRATSRDHLPFVGPVVDFSQLKHDYEALNPQAVRDQKIPMPRLHYYPNLYCLVGLGGRGLCSAPFAAETLAAIMHGEPLAVSEQVMKAIHPARTWLRRMKKGRPLQAQEI